MGPIISSSEDNADEYALRVDPRQASDFNSDTDIDLSYFSTLSNVFSTAPNEKCWNCKAGLNDVDRTYLNDFFAFFDSFKWINTLPKQKEGSSLSSALFPIAVCQTVYFNACNI